MNLSAPFIRRPVATSLLTMGVILSGMVAYFQLPVSPLPQTDSPTITIQSSLPGASPEIMASSVATPLERSLAHIAGVTEMTSSSETGSTTISMQFDLDRNIDGAAGDVQSAINAARKLLPPTLPRNPTYHKVNRSDAPIMIVALTSDTLPQGDLYDAASTILTQRISQIEGIGQVDVGGSSLPAVRVELNPNILSKYGISLERVRNIIENSNPNRPKGSLSSEAVEWQIATNDRLRKAADYQSLIIAHHNGNPVRLSDVAEIIDSVEDLRNAGSSNGKPSVLLILYKQPEANIIETVEQVIQMLPQLRRSISPAIDLSVMMDRTSSIRASLREVEHTLIIAVMLVVLVVFFFLGHWRSTLIPAVAIPVSLIGTFAVMYLLGFSINNLSLMALTVATGFVIDDALVVLENITRHIEKDHMTPMQAALRGAREVGFTVAAMSISLVAVFIPILLMGGIVGRLFREFAITLSSAVLISLVVSLTLTPMMCAFLPRHMPESKFNPFSKFNKNMFSSMLEGYKTTLAWSLDHKRFILLLLLCTAGLNICLYIFVPKGFFPEQDTGRLQANVQADQDISFQAMRGKLDEVIAIIRQDTAVENVVGFTGQGQRDVGRIFVTLKPLEIRHASAEQVLERLRKTLVNEPGIRVYWRATQEIHIGARQGGAQYQYTVQADDLKALRRWSGKIVGAMRQLPVITDVTIDERDKGPQTSIMLDRDRMYQLGLTPDLVDDLLNDAFGQRLASNIFRPLNQYHVVLEVAPEFWQSATALETSYAINQGGTAVPFSEFSHHVPATAALDVNHHGQFPAATVSFNLAPDVSLSQASEAITNAVYHLNPPDSVHGSFQGTARVFKESVKNQPILILVALITIYIVLGILYESYIHPITIISTLPSAGTGAILALLLFHTEFTIIAFIGIILLIGIVMKNAIMMIDFAIEAQHNEGMDPRKAISEACELRFRPIMMTTFAAFLGVLPLSLAMGYGAELRQPLGISIIGGLLVSQVLTLYTTPVIYLYFESLQAWIRRSRPIPLNPTLQPSRGIPI